MRGHLKNLILTIGPPVALQEILYGFIMSLIFVYATMFGVLHYEGRGEFILVVTGMLLTWGTIDAIILFALNVFEQRRYCRIISGGYDSDRETRLSVLMDDMSGTPADVLTDDDKRKICEYMLDRPLADEKGLREDRKGFAISSLGCIILTAATLIPVILPLLLIDDMYTALCTVSHISSVCLFVIGYFMAPYLGTNRFLTGATLAGVSLAIAAISVFTGG